MYQSLLIIFETLAQAYDISLHSFRYMKIEKMSNSRTKTTSNVGSLPHQLREKHLVTHWMSNKAPLVTPYNLEKLINYETWCTWINKAPSVSESHRQSDKLWKQDVHEKIRQVTHENNGRWYCFELPIKCLTVEPEFSYISNMQLKEQQSDVSQSYQRGSNIGR